MYKAYMRYMYKICIVGLKSQRGWSLSMCPQYLYLPFVYFTVFFCCCYYHSIFEVIAEQRFVALGRGGKKWSPPMKRKR